MNSDIRPAFFKLMVSEDDKKRVLIPENFVQYISKDSGLGDIAILEGPSGGFWKAELKCCGESIYLRDGWRKFVKDHSLGDNEFLVFKYDGKLSFEVQIFEKNGLKRDGEGSCSLDDEPALPASKRPVRELKKLKVKSNGVKLGRPRKIKMLKDYNVRQRMIGAEARFSAEEIKSFASKNPFVKICLRKGATEYPHMLILPTEFCRRHLPDENFTLTINNARGRGKQVNSVYATRKHTFCKGWVDFARSNNLKKGDVLILELVSQREMLVHIFPQ